MKEFEKQIREEHDANCTCGLHEHYLQTTTTNNKRNEANNMENKTSNSQAVMSVDITGGSGTSIMKGKNLIIIIFNYN